jgi:hypothetical protein
LHQHDRRTSFLYTLGVGTEGDWSSSESERLGGDAEFLRVLGDDADGQEAEDEIVGFVADDLMIVQVPDGADGREFSAQPVVLRRGNIRHCFDVALEIFATAQGRFAPQVIRRHHYRKFFTGGAGQKLTHRITLFGSEFLDALQRANLEVRSSVCSSLAPNQAQEIAWSNGADAESLRAAKVLHIMSNNIAAPSGEGQFQYHVVIR